MDVLGDHSEVLNSLFTRLEHAARIVGDDGTANVGAGERAD
jgi:hypothetical protein